MPAVVTTRVVTRDSAATERALDVWFPTIRLNRGDPAAFRARVEASVGRRFAVVDYGFDGGGGGVSNSNGFTVVRTVGRDLGLSHGRAAIDPTVPFLAPSTGLAGSWSSVAAVAVELDPVGVAAIARSAAGVDDLVLERTGTTSIGPDALRRWDAVLAGFRRTLAMAPDAFDEPMIERSAFELLATAFLHAFPTNWQDATARGRAPARVSPVVRLALEFIHAHAAAPITIQDIADAVPISTRGLHHAFVRQLGEPPRVVLQRARLDGARRDLLDSRPGDSVRLVARRWGFAQPSRFVAAYVREFGEEPFEPRTA
ncbi:AraC family transcriptional regulator [Agromyces sp. LHK192]|uniref:AraC family transcriptional regulator n=1 Tax=Agromyces sp. LHK192 TaxID=2498704 RepID=UPI000FD770FC|nr:AraC family transcriptional regulator [Agromyces sp. LHK192]